PGEEQSQKLRAQRRVVELVALLAARSHEDLEHAAALEIPLPLLRKVLVDARVDLSHGALHRRRPAAGPAEDRVQRAARRKRPRVLDVDGSRAEAVRDLGETVAHQIAAGDAL